MLMRFAALGGGEAAARLLAFLGTVYLARTLPPALYGVVGFVAGVMLYLTQVVDRGVELVGVGLTAHADAADATLVPPLVAARFRAAAVVIGTVVLAGLVLLPQPDGALLAGASLTLLATALSTRWLHVGHERVQVVAVARTLGEGTALVLTVLLVRDAGSVEHLPGIQFGGAIFASGVMLAALRRRGAPLRWDDAREVAAPVLRRGRPVVAFTLLGLVLFNFDLLFLRAWSGADSAGYYAVAYAVIAFLANLLIAFAHALLPSLARHAGDAPARDVLFADAMAQALAVTLPLAVGAWYVAPMVLEGVYGSAYLPGVVALRWLLASIPLAAVRELVIAALLAGERETDVLRVNAVAVACNVLLVVGLVPAYGLAGAAIATLVAEIVRTWLAIRALGRAGYRGFAPGRLVKPGVATAVMSGALWFVAPGSVWSSVPLGIASYALVLAGVGGLVIGRRAIALRV